MHTNAMGLRLAFSAALLLAHSFPSDHNDNFSTADRRETWWHPHLAAFSSSVSTSTQPFFQRATALSRGPLSLRHATDDYSCGDVWLRDDGATGGTHERLARLAPENSESGVPLFFCGCCWLLRISDDRDFRRLQHKCGCDSTNRGNPCALVTRRLRGNPCCTLVKWN